MGDSDPATTSTRVVRAADATAVATEVADRLVSELADLQARGESPALVLTGGSIARRVHAAVAGHPHREQVDWGDVDFWWGDERFVPSGDPERNAGQAWEDMLGRLPVDPARVHAMPASDDGHRDAGSAALAYQRELHDAVRARPQGSAWFDVLMLGIGPDGHCASLFPGRPEVGSDADVLPVHDSPKPPPTRISLGMGPLRRAKHVMFVAAGEEKADAVARSVHDDDLDRTPAAGPRGTVSTTWYVDEAAARRLG